MTTTLPSSTTSSTQTYFDPTPLVSGWTTRPIPSFTLSAAGLLALADLSTVAQRTALRGGSSWFDSLTLVPGLHYQQAADELARSEGATILIAVEDPASDGTVVRHRIVNQAVVNYVLRIAKEGETVLLDVGDVPSRSRPKEAAFSSKSQRAMLYAGGEPEPGEELSWAAHLLYLATPALTCVAVVLIVLLSDWWALALIIALMISRILNIFVIKSRSRPKPPTLPAPFTDPDPGASVPYITQYTITLNPITRVVLRGLSTDLYALTTTIWLRPKTYVEGYLEAIAKVLVYLVAAVSGNATQAGNIILLSLLLSSAGLLALSNARVTGLRNNGKIVAPHPPDAPGSKGNLKGGRDNNGLGNGARVDRGHAVHPRAAAVGRPNRMSEPSHPVEMESWPETSESSSMACKDDTIEQRRAANVHRRTYPADDPVAYELRLEEGLGITPAKRVSEPKRRW